MLDHTKEVKRNYRCDGCGTLGKWAMMDEPYQEEINDVIERVRYCPECYMNSCNDI